jgi:serine/threonine-protein kinase
VAARVARDAARILQWAHERGVVHRDVKPGNLMLVDGEVYLVDFGLARPVGGAGSLTGGIAGTMAYMSREQAAGEAPSPDFDVYSLGAALYRLVTGRAPVEASTMLELLTKLETPAAAPRSLNPEVPFSLQSVIVKAMDERGHRYATAGAMADDLDRVLRGEPVDIRGRRLRSVKRALPAIAIGVAALLAVWFGWKRIEGHARADRLVEKARRTAEDARVRLYMKGATFTDAFYHELDGALAQARESASLKASADAFVVIGRIEQILGNHEAARAAYAKAATPEGEFRLARSYVEEAAEEIFAGREESGALLLLSAERHFAAAGESSGVDADLVKAWRMVAAGDYEAAAEFARERTMASEEFWVVLGLAGFRRDPTRAALRELSGAIDARPNYYEAYVCRAYLLKSRNSLDYARKDAERALEIHPRYARAWEALAAILHEAGDGEGEARARAQAARWRRS